MKICVIAPLVGVGFLGLSLATTSNATQYNPKELPVKKSVPWQQSRKPSGKTISSTNPSASPTPGKSVPKSSGKVEYPKLSSYVPEADSTKPVATKHGSASSTEISAPPQNAARKKPGRTTFSNIVLERGSHRGPTLSANPGASVSPVRATTNVKVKEAARMSLPSSNPAASPTPRPALKK